MIEIRNQGFDHIEIAVHDLARHVAMYERLGFEQIGRRKLDRRGLETVAMGQGYVRVLLTRPIDGAQAAAKEETAKFLKVHGEGVCTLAVDVDDASKAFDSAVERGARVAMKPETYETPEGQVVRAEIFTPSDLRYAFVQRKVRTAGGKALLDDGLVVDRLESPSPMGIRVIDHLTNNVDMGEMPKWVEWYKRVFGFIVSRHFDISTGRTGLTSDVVQSENGRVIVPINQATEPQSQVQEFVTRFKGPGVQHVAFLTLDIQPMLTEYRKRGFKFLTVPSTYYEAVPKRVKGVTEDLRKLEELGILVDGDDTGYLLQIFSEEIMGPFFFEFIQRKGNKGFGEGNFKALFEAIERDQIKRGVLKA